MVTVQIKLKQDEANALYQLAERERRGVREQAAIMLRHDLERLGLLQPDEPASTIQIVTPAEAQHATRTA
jgi:hypothetical protein